MKKFLILTVVLVAMMSTAAFADSITAQMTGVNQVTFYVQNTGNISSVADAISGFFFTCSGCTGAPHIDNSGSGATVDVATGGGTTFGTTTSAGWGLSTFGSSYFMSTFKTLGGTYGPAYTIIGDTITCTNKGSICGNTAHNPFLYTSTSTYITFVLTIPGLTSTTQLSNLRLWYNTEPPTRVPQVPEPASLLMLGTGLVGIGGAIRRKIRL